MERILKTIKTNLEEIGIDIIKLANEDQEEIEKYKSRMKEIEDWNKKKEEFKKPKRDITIHNYSNEDYEDNDFDEASEEDGKLGWKGAIDARRCFYCFDDHGGERIIKQGDHFYHISCAESLLSNPLKREIIVKILDEYYSDDWSTNDIDKIKEYIGDELIRNYKMFIEDIWFHLIVITESKAIEIKLSYEDYRVRSDDEIVVLSIDLLNEFNDLLIQ